MAFIRLVVRTKVVNKLWQFVSVRSSKDHKPYGIVCFDASSPVFKKRQVAKLETRKAPVQFCHMNWSTFHDDGFFFGWAACSTCNILRHNKKDNEVLASQPFLSWSSSQFPICSLTGNFFQALREKNWKHWECNSSGDIYTFRKLIAAEVNFWPFQLQLFILQVMATDRIKGRRLFNMNRSPRLQHYNGMLKCFRFLE